MRGRTLGLAVLAAASIVLLYGTTLEAAQFAAFAIILVVVADIDSTTRRIPNMLVLVALAVRVSYIVAVWLVDSAAASALLIHSLVGAAVIGGGLFAFTLMVNNLRGGENMGGGDIKLFAVTGFYFGLSAGIAVMALACILGAGATLVPQKKPKGDDAVVPDTFPLGPAISVSAIAAMLVMSPVVQQIVYF